MSVYNGRLRYPQRSVSGAIPTVADNEPALGRPPVLPVPGFVVGHHRGTVTVDVRNRCHCELTLDDALKLATQLLSHRDLAMALAALTAPTGRQAAA